MIRKTLFFLLIVFFSSSLLFGQSKKLTVWDRDNDHVKKKLEYPAQPQGVTGDWLVVRLSAEPDHLEPYTSTGAYAQRIYSYIYSSLLTQDGWTLKWNMGKNTNSLATSFKVEDLLILRNKTRHIGIWTKKGKTYTLITHGKKMTFTKKEVLKAQKNVVYTFDIRKDAVFHDGVKLTGKDVIFSMDVVKNKNVNAPSYRNYFKDVKEWGLVKENGKANPYKVRFIYSKPYWYALTIMSGLSIIPSHAFDWKQFGKDIRYVANKDGRFAKYYNNHEFRRHPIGSGPYVFDKWVSGDKIIIKRNKKYWGKPAYIDKIIWKYISEEAAALQALKNGEIDFMPTTSTEIFMRDARGVKFEKKFVKAHYYVPGYGYVGWNMRRFLFKDRRVRRAMTQILPRKQILKSLAYGMGKIITGPFYFFGPVYDHKLKPWPFDPKAAKKLLLEAGWADQDGDGILDKDGKKFEFDLLFLAGRKTSKLIAERFQEEAGRVGVKINLLQLKWQAVLHKVNQLDFDAVMMGWGSVVEGDPYQIWHSSQTMKRGSNHVGYKNPRVDRIIVKGRTIFKTKKRRALYRRMQKIIYYDQPYTFLFMTPNKTIYHSRFRGVRWLKPRPGWDLQEWYVPKKLQKYHDK